METLDWQANSRDANDLITTTTAACWGAAKLSKHQKSWQDWGYCGDLASGYLAHEAGKSHCSSCLHLGCKSLQYIQGWATSATAAAAASVDPTVPVAGTYSCVAHCCSNYCCCSHSRHGTCSCTLYYYIKLHCWRAFNCFCHHRLQLKGPISIFRVLEHSLHCCVQICASLVNRDLHVADFLVCSNANEVHQQPPPNSCSTSRAKFQATSSQPHLHL